ncbi:hypothetical protein F4678DRAFT_335507 [Xylaria arbuscula]|nr:hypothetical protein F4678DRAFT_335507 [Xylaria arbuscula]
MSATPIPQRFDEFTKITEVYNLDNTHLLTVSAISFTIGYVEYIYALRLHLNEGKGPFPLWQHLFYFAHDTTWVYILSNAPYDHWFFFWCPVSFAVWGVFEALCIYRAVFVEGEDVASDQLRRHSKKQSLWYIVVFTAAMYGFVFLVFDWVGPTCILEFSAFCNTVFVLGFTETSLRRGSRNGLSVALALLIVVGTIFTFAPFGMMVQAAPEVFDHPSWYFLGVALTILAITNVFTVTSYPPKALRKGQTSAIW